jgi:S1-C subfamily serine protease
MKRAPLISPSPRSAAGRRGVPAGAMPGLAPTPPDAGTRPASQGPRANASDPARAVSADARSPHPGTAPPRSPVTAPAGWRARVQALRGPLRRSAVAAWAPWAVAAAFALLALSLLGAQRPRVITQDDIDLAVRASLEKEPLPSPYARAAAAVAPSLVRVQGLMSDDDDGEENAQRRALERSLGTGVVIVDNGTILTNLHVVWGARKIRVHFHNGHVSEAQLVNVSPDNDLAVLKAASLPDDLQAATMRSTGDLQPGDQVVAVGFPFGIGPSVSGGVVSGLKREFRDPEGKKLLTNLIQFDAAANPGNSGGPLVTMDGNVVGIVTAILNPTESRTFIGIGFAVPIENAASAVGIHPF